MRLRPALAAAALLLTLPLAGCADGPEPSSPEGDTGPTASTGPAASTAPAAPPEPALVEVALPFEREGRTWTTACVVVQPVAGHCQHVAQGSAVTEWLPEGEGGLAALAGAITWSDGNAELGIGLVVEAEDGSVAMHSPDHYASGPSPLAFAFDLRGLEASGRVGFHVASYTGTGTPEAHADVSPGQDWALAGTLTVLRPA